MKCLPPWRILGTSVILARNLLIFWVLLLLAATVLSIVLRTPYRVNVPPLDITESDFNGTVAIVGAGAAGMFAAYTLEYLGINYILLEADQGYGGRTKEIDSFVDVPLDLGAEWIHVHPDILQDLLLFDDEVVDDFITYQPQTIRLYRQGGKPRRANFIKWFYAETKFKESTWFSYLQENVYPYVADQLEVNQVVESIDYSQEDVVVITVAGGRTIECDRVIIATPVSVLQHGDVQFIPEIGDRRFRELNGVDMTAGLKAWIEFKERFYPDLIIMRDAEDKLYFDALFRKPSEKNVLALFEVGSSAYERVELDDNAILKDILLELDAMFDGRASELYIQHHVENWSGNQFIKGAYSYNSYKEAPLLIPLDGRIYFCGEYVGGEHQSTVHGAALSGRSVAQNVLIDYRNSPRN